MKINDTLPKGIEMTDSDPTMVCLRRASQKARGSLVMATSQTHAREVVVDLRRLGYAATRCGKFIVTNAPFKPAARASRIRR